MSNLILVTESEENKHTVYVGVTISTGFPALTSEYLRKECAEAAIKSHGQCLGILKLEPTNDNKVIISVER